MDLSANTPCGDSSKENVTPGFDAPAVQRSKRRTVLGALSDNELQGQSLDQVSQTRNLLLLCSVMSLHGAYLVMSSLSSVCLQASQFSKHSSASDRSHLKPRSGPSSSSVDVQVEEEAREVVLTASGQPLGSDHPDTESSALENDDARLLLDLISGLFGTCIVQVTLVSRAKAVICSCRFRSR